MPLPYLQVFLINVISRSSKGLLLISVIALLQSCSSSRQASKNNHSTVSVTTKTAKKSTVPARVINTGNVSAASVVEFAKTLIGIKYKYGSSKKENGFDCSGFITYVFSNFNIAVPRSSVDFTNAGIEIPLKESAKGDLILFTGSDASSGIVGHMGIINQNRKGKISFIHAASGNSRGVMISEMNSYFSPRFIKVIRVFKPDR